MIRRLLPPILFLNLLASGCDRDDETIRVYSIPKIADAAPPRMMDTSSIAAAPSKADEIRWTAPQSWTALPASAMRFAAFAILPDHSDAQVTIVPLGIESGELLPNVNRWRGQLKLPLIDGSELNRSISQIQVDKISATKIELSNANQQILAVMIPRGEKIWFVKMIGPSDVIASQRDQFDSFVQSLRFDQAMAEDEVHFTPADDWQRKPDLPMRFASFVAPPDAEVIISKFPAANSGTYLDNLNRWRAQVSLPPIENPSEQTSSPIKIDNTQGMRLDLIGPAPDSKRVILAVVPRAQDFWYFKLIGPADSVAQQEKTFDAFLNSVHFDTNHAGEAK